MARATPLRVLQDSAVVPASLLMTRVCWLNQVEIWFSILEGKSLQGAFLTSVKQLREQTKEQMTR
jgi:hypothetical protein